LVLSKDNKAREVAIWAMIMLQLIGELTRLNESIYMLPKAHFRKRFFIQTPYDLPRIAACSLGAACETKLQRIAGKRPQKQLK
jgi:hypothetical protein